MKELLKQWSSVLGASFAAACCLGVTAALSVLTALGAGFLINDVFLIPFYLGLLMLSVWLLGRSARHHASIAPVWTAVAGAVLAFAGLWIAPVLVYGGLAVLIASSVWDFWSARRTARASSRELR